MQRVSFVRLTAESSSVVKKQVVRSDAQILLHSLTWLWQHSALTAPLCLDVGQETLLTVITYPPWQNHPFHFRQV
jgi:hypothetical protein